MNCRKAEKLVHRLMDGDLKPRQENAVLMHIADCEKCARYYKEMTAISRAAYLPDPEVPAGFRENWRQALSGSRRVKMRTRRTKMIPALACGIAGVVVLSTALINPQAFGLKGEKLRSLTGELTPTAVPESSVTPVVAPIVFNDVVSPSRIPKPATQNAEYWEETAWSTVSPSQVVAGDIESPSETTDYTDSDPEYDIEHGMPVEAVDLVAPGEATLLAMRSLAENMDDMSVIEADGIYLEGTPEAVVLFLDAFDCHAPEGTTKLHITCEEAE